MTSTVETAHDIRPFHVDIPDQALDDLRRRIAAARWPSRELVPDRSQGVQLATIQELARYWATEYDWRKAEAKLNALPQFTTTIDGVDTSTRSRRAATSPPGRSRSCSPRRSGRRSGHCASRSDDGRRSQPAAGSPQAVTEAVVNVDGY